MILERGKEFSLFAAFTAIKLASFLGLLIFMAACSSRPSSFIILCAGDSLTQQGYPVYLRQFLHQEGIRARVHNFGRSGHNSTEYLSFLRARGSELAALRPDFILLELGTNDVRIDGDRTPLPAFEANIREIIQIFFRFRNRWEQRPQIFLALIPPIPEGVGYPFDKQSSERVEREINPVILRLAAELGIPTIDHWKIFRERPELLPGVHPNPEGYQEMARAWLEALRPFLRR